MRSLPVLALLLAACGCSDDPAEPRAARPADEFTERLRALPAVGHVEVFGEGPRTLVHIADYHIVPMEDFRAELPEDVTDTEAERLYEDFLSTVDAVQAQQVVVLRAVGVQEVWQERLIVEEAQGFNELAKAMRIAGPGERGTEYGEMYTADLREGGAVLRLLVSEELDVVQPADDAVLLAAADPLKVGWDSPLISERERAIVQRVTGGGARLVVLVCGGSHRLAKYLPEGWRLVRIEVKAWQKAVEGE